MDRYKRGFSLPEQLAIVLALSIAASVAIPNLSATDPNKLDLAVEEVAQAMRFARSEAIRTGEPHGFRHRAATRRIRVFRVDTQTTPWSAVYDVLHPVSKKLYDIELDKHLFARVDSLNNQRIYRGTCTKSANVYFDASGIPRCLEPETILLDSYEVEFALSGLVRTLTLDSITGRVVVR